MFKKVVYNSGVQVIGKIITLILSVTATILLTRRLGTNGYGQYVIIFSFVSFLVAIGEWGTQIIGVRELARSQNKGAVFGSLFALRTLLALAASIIGVVIVVFLPLFADIKTISLFSLFLVFGLINESSMETVFQSLVRMDLKVIINIFSSIIFLTATVFLLKLNPNIWAPITGWLLALVLTTVSSFLIAKKLLKDNKITISLPLISRLIRESLPMGALLIMFSTYDRVVDSFFVKHFFGSTEVGLYGLAYKIYGNLILPAYFLANSIFPMLSNSKSQNFKKTLKLGFIFIGLGLLVLVPIVLIFAKPIVVLIAGNEFIPAIPVLKILTLALVFSYINHLTGFSLIALNKQASSFKIGVIALIWNFISNLVFIPKFGIIAAAWVTLSTELLVALLSLRTTIKLSLSNLSRFERENAC